MAQLKKENEILRKKKTKDKQIEELNSEYKIIKDELDNFKNAVNTD